MTHENNLSVVSQIGSISPACVTKINNNNSIVLFSKLNAHIFYNTYITQLIKKLN